jgi:HSP20 family protein
MEKNMSIIHWEPFAEMEETFNRFPIAFGTNTKGFVPATDMYETKEAVIVEAPLAGVKPADVDVSVQNGVLTIQGESKKEHEVDEKNYYRKEVRGGSFYRQVTLPCPVKEDTVTAQFKDGVLEVKCPKTTPKEAKKIKIEVVDKK